MRQAFHIFRKDARHCWPYIAAVLALMAANVWLGTHEMPGHSRLWQIERELFTSLVVVAWWLTIGAAVHGESQAGDRQFWLTRPYWWTSLLAAKLLFLAAFVALPVLLSDCIILIASGFNPLTLLPGLLLRQCWLAAFLAAPLLVASLTRSARDFVLTGLAFWIGAGVALALVDGYGLAFRASFWWVGSAAQWLFPVAGLSLAFWLNARRRVTPIRVLAVVLAVLALFLGSPSSYLEARRMVNGEPRFRTLAIRFDPARPHQPASPGRPWRFNLPVVIDNWAANLVNYASVDGSVLDRGSQVGTVQGDVAAGRDGRGWIELYVFPDGVQAGNVDLSLFVRAAVFERQGSAILRSAGGWTRVSGFANVALMPVDPRNVELLARTALRPRTGQWLFRLDTGTESALPADYLSVPVSPLTFHLSPVYSSWAAAGFVGDRPTVLTTYRQVAEIQQRLKISQIRLDEYADQSPR